MRVWNYVKIYWNSIKRDTYERFVTFGELSDDLGSRFPNCKVEVTDLLKRGTNYKKLKELSSLMPMKFKRYEKEVFDCEDFSIMAWGVWKALFPRMPIGLCLVNTKSGGKHALLCAVYVTKGGDLRFAFIEPQTNKVFYSVDYSPYLIII